MAAAERADTDSSRTPSRRAEAAQTALVFGGGGLVGMAYHAAALKALDERGFDVTGADLTIGTSAGAVIASYLVAAGWSQTDFYEYAHSRHPRRAEEPADEREAVRRLFEPLWNNRVERARRSVGSMFALAASRGIWRRVGGGVPASTARRLFPSGLYSTDDSRRRIAAELPDEWPERSLYICTSELYTGKRVVFGAPGAPPAPPAEAVLASTAIPGVFPPVNIGGRPYVDGGAYSATSLDLAADAGARSIICIAPLGYRGEGELILRDPKVWLPMATRTLWARPLAREVKQARADGSDVLVIRPWTKELRELGANAMRHFDRGAMADMILEGVLRQLDEVEGHPALAPFARTAA